MGSWSVSCGISKIAITAGQECVLLPIKKTQYQSYSYLTHTPQTMGILGAYDDYGGVEDIVEDENTKLISKHFGISIEDFCSFLVDGPHTYDRDEVKPITKKTRKGWFI